ncbi:MAG: excinuclease ABC subunit UvrC [Desulfovibrionaceae bacterium]|nr:excinuclease ABC subunit UvrC [Desulfovibrionaceae bacterium]
MQKPDLSLFPAEPGVYLFKDASGKIIYVGKARRLRHRLASYFRDASALTAKTRLMLEKAESIDILRTATDKEALLLEASLIKKHRPRYNIVLRDDKEYLLFRIGGSHPYPRVEVLRRNQRRGKSRDKGERWFGPFSSGFAARETWKLLHKHFPLRRCRDISFANRTRPCLYHDMGRCLAPCVLPVPPEEYRSMLDEVGLLLSGKSRELLDSLSSEMIRAAEDMRFEEAAVLRDRIRAVERTIERQSVVLDGKRTLDLIGVTQVPEGLALGVVFVREGLLIDGRNFFWPGLSVEDTPELLGGFLAQFYLDRQGLGESIPPRVVVPWLPETGQNSAMEGDESGPGISIAGLEAALAEVRGGPVHITRPRDADEDRLLLMAASNAREAVKSTAHASMAELLAKCFRAPGPIRRIEVVDVSHTGGQQTRAGMVVFEDEQPVPQSYRTYALDENLAEAEAETGDDYAALAAWAKRRAAGAEENPWPDLILVDGGKGQLAAVHRAFSEAGIRTGAQKDDAFMLASIAKARDDDGKADRRAGNVSDRIFLPGRSNPLALPAGSPELLFLQRLRDAAHDFVIGRHRQARAAATLSGELTRLPGVGPKLARGLFERFGSLAAMADAGEDTLASVPGIGKQRAKAIAARLSLLVEKNDE